MRKHKFLAGEFYHIYNRGNSKQNIFLDPEDYDRFKKLLFLCNSKKSLDFKEKVINQKIDAYSYDRGESIVDVCAWVLMKNHFHLLIFVPEGRTFGNELTSFLRKVSTAYTMYFNKKYTRTGSLFEGKFKSEHLDNDNYLKYIFSYIHLNPLKYLDYNWKQHVLTNTHKFLTYLEKYSHSSYHAIILNKNSKESKILNLDFLMSRFGPDIDLKKDFLSWLSGRSDLRD